eukprot:749146-Hanusia_phi.AAC.4
MRKHASATEYHPPHPARARNLLGCARGHGLGSPPGYLEHEAQRTELHSLHLLQHHLLFYSTLERLHRRLLHLAEGWKLPVRVDGCAHGALVEPGTVH